MPIIKSARKRVKVAAKANARNSRTRRNLREALKTFARSLENGKSDEISKAEKAAMSAIDVAAKKAVIHKNKAARKKAQVSAQVKARGAKQAKPAVKKSVNAKTTKKPVAKKAPASKKSPSKK